MAKADSTAALPLDTLEEIQKQLVEVENSFVAMIDAALESSSETAGIGTIMLFKYAAEAGFEELQSAGKKLSKLLPEKGGAA